MEQESAVFAIAAGEEGRELASHIAQALGYSHAHTFVGAPREAIPALNARTSPPAYLVIDIGNRGTDVIGELDALAQHCEPNVRVVVLGHINDVGFYRELKQRGILEYFPHPVKIAEIRAALLASADSGSGSTERGRVIAFMSAASGDGASTVALNTAYCMAHLCKLPTVIVDMDYQYGMVAKNLDLHPQFGIRELFEHPDRGIDATLISRMLADYRQQLKIIAAPNELRFLPMVKPEIIRDLILALQEKHRYVILDLPHIWTTWIAAALSNATDHVLVGQLWLRSVTHAARLLNGWQSIGIERKGVSMVINRSGAKFKEAVSPKDFERVSGKAIDHHLANDIRTIAEAENLGKTVLEVGNTALGDQLKAFTASFLPENERQALYSQGNLATRGFASLFGKR